jgi:hypothetical protein
MNFIDKPLNELIVLHGNNNNNINDSNEWKKTKNSFGKNLFMLLLED